MNSGPQRQGKKSKSSARCVCPVCGKRNLEPNENHPRFSRPHCFTFACRFNALGASSTASPNLVAKAPKIDNEWRGEVYARKYGKALAITPDTIAAEYFMRTRAIDFDAIGSVPRFSPREPFYVDGEKVGVMPAIISPIRTLDGAIVSLQLIYLDATAQKFAVKFKTAIRPGALTAASVQLHQPSEILVVGEGIESCLSLAELTGQAAWAALSANSLANFMPPPVVRELWIAEDFDPAGQQASELLARRMEKMGIASKILSPAFRGTERKGFDWNDLIRERKGRTNG